MISIVLRVFLLVMVAAVMAIVHDDPAAEQIIIFKERTSGPIAVMTTASGAPIEYEEATATLNERLIFNEYFMDSMTHFVRERIPERSVHAKGAGAFGYFELTHDVSDICKAKLFNKVGKRTPVAVRFSLVIADKGTADTTRGARGFAIKFYTEEGNFDIVGFNTPMFTFKDPVIFSSLIRAQRRNPVTNLDDQNMFWDIATLRPEILHIFLLVFSDRGIPDGYRHMPGFGIHTFQVVNDQGESSFVRFHFQPDLGVKNLKLAKARQLVVDDPDYSTRDLYNAIAKGHFPSWTASIQVLSMKDIKNAGFDVFDVSKVLPLEKYPLRPLGRLVLNKNPINYFAEVEQLAFCPMNLVPGILGAPDKMFESRRFSYRDAQNYRLGANFLKIPVNSPLQNEAYAYNRDGNAPVGDNMKGIPNYYPNTFNGPVPYKEVKRANLIEIYQDEANNFEQARDVYVNEMSRGERKRLVENILNNIRPIATFLQERVAKTFALIHPDLGARLLAGIQANTTSTG